MSGKQRLSVSVDADLLAAARAAVAVGRAESVSSWVSDALRRQTEHERRLRALDAFIAAYEAEHGEITEAEIRAATRAAHARAIVVRGAEAEPQVAGGGAVTVVLDTGALVSIERGDRALVALLKAELLSGRTPVTHGGVVGQAWRGGSGRQANLARALAGLEIVALDDALGRRAGLLLGRAGRADVIDAAVVLLAEDGDLIFTSDPDDLRSLAVAAGTHLELFPV